MPATADKSKDYAANAPVRKWLYPNYKDDPHGAKDDWKFMTKPLCPHCYQALQDEADAVANRYQNWVGGTKGEVLRGYQIVKFIGRVEENRRMRDPDSVAKCLKISAARIGGNGYINFFWERHQLHQSEDFVAGYGKNGNPYYKTHHWTEVWYTGYATAVWAEKSTPKKAKS